MAGASACPTADDLTTGIRVEYGEDGYSIVTRDPSGVIRETEYAGEDVYVYITANGLLETAYEEPAANTFDTFEYTFDTTGLFPLKPWSGQRGEQIARDRDGNEFDRLGYSYHTRGQGQYTIGECQFTSIPFQTYYDNPDEQSVVEFVYLMELGIPLAIGYGGPGYFDAHRPTDISAVR